MLKIIRTIAIIALTYFIAAFAHWTILWPSETSFMENLTWAVAALWLSALPFVFYDKPN